MNSLISRIKALIPLLLLMILAGPALADGKVTVFGAASLKNALDDLSQQWTAKSQTEVANSYAGSSSLARQIEQGAPADIFISADLEWMTYLRDKALIAPGSDVQLLGNQIVLVAPADSKTEVTIAPGFDLKAALNQGKLAMGDVKAVPAGKYGKAALESLGVWPSVAGDVVQAENVRAALKLVDVGEAALGIVYLTDAQSDKQVRVVGTFPENSHPPIIYPMGLTLAGAQNPPAQAFATYLKSPEAGEVFKKYGFTVLTP